MKRSYTVPLRTKFANTPRYKRTNKAVRVLKEFLVKHMKSDNVKIGPKLNETLWQDGIKNPPGKVKIVATKDDTGMVRAELEGVEYVDFKVQEKKADPTTLKEKIEAKLDGDNKKKPVKKADKQESEKQPAVKETEKPEEKVEKAETKAPKKEAKEEAPAKSEEPKAE
ncbi:60S ribosomal protein L31 [Candidatus Woesearchaeota archaeon]|nr:60S ribosomal protein L31 [Candidatus Woesearchaeota archaeon]